MQIKEECGKIVFVLIIKSMGKKEQIIKDFTDYINSIEVDSSNWIKQSCFLYLEFFTQASEKLQYKIVTEDEKSRLYESIWRLFEDFYHRNKAN